MVRVTLSCVNGSFLFRSVSLFFSSSLLLSFSTVLLNATLGLICICNTCWCWKGASRYTVARNFYLKLIDGEHETVLDDRKANRWIDFHSIQCTSVWHFQVIQLTIQMSILHWMIECSFNLFSFLDCTTDARLFILHISFLLTQHMRWLQLTISNPCDTIYLSLPLSPCTWQWQDVYTMDSIHKSSVTWARITGSMGGTHRNKWRRQRKSKVK